MKNDYNHLIDVHYKLIQVFLVPIENNILDISYELIDNELYLQLIIINNTKVKKELREKLFKVFPEFFVKINEIELSIQDYNSNKELWQPINYKWFKYLLFSRKEY